MARTIRIHTQPEKEVYPLLPDQEPAQPDLGFSLIADAITHMETSVIAALDKSSKLTSKQRRITWAILGAIVVSNIVMAVLMFLISQHILGW